MTKSLIKRFYPLKQINSKSQIEAKRDGKAGAFSIIAYLMLIRPENVLITALSVFVAGLISSVHWLQFGADLSKAVLSAALIAAGGNVFNDYCDRDLDRIQKPHRPIPAGRISHGAALRLTAGCFFCGLLIALTIGGAAFLIASWAVFLLLLYSWRWKRTILLGNLTIAFIAALAFIYGGVAVRSVGAALWAAGLAFLFHLGREVVKDMEDHWGDAAGEACTLVVRYGINAGRWAASASFLLLILFLPFPYHWGGFRIGYLYIALFGVLPMLLMAVFWVWRWTKPQQLHRLNVMLKWDMLVGLAALLIGRPNGW